MIMALADRAPTGGLASWLERYDDVDVIVLLGDLDERGMAALHDHPSHESAGPLRLGVYGNHCDHYFDDLAVVNMHAKVIEHGGKRFRGLEGCPRYSEGPHQHTEAEIAMALREPSALPGEIILSHTPPFKAGDHARMWRKDPIHTGWKSLRRHCKQSHPAIILHGHTSPRQREVRVGNTIVHYVNGISILRLIDDRVELVDTDCTYLD